MLLLQVIETLTGCRRSLPFISNGTSESQTILKAVTQAFMDESTSLSSDALLTELALGILELEKKARKLHPR